MVLGLYNYLFAGDDDWKRKRAINQMKYSWKSFLPGSGAWKEWSGLWSGKKDIKRNTILYWEERRTKKHLVLCLMEHQDMAKQRVLENQDTK